MIEELRFNNAKPKSRAVRVLSTAALSVILGLILWKSGQIKASSQEILLASAVYFLCVLPTLIHIKRGDKTIPYLPIFAMIYFIYYAYAVFTNYGAVILEGISEFYVIKALMLTTGGITAMYLSFYTPLGALTNFVPHLKVNWDTSKAFRIGIILGVCGIFAYLSQVVNYGRIPLRFQSVWDFTASLSMLAIVILYLLHLQKKLPIFAKIFLWGFLVPVRLFLDVVNGATYAALLDIITILLVYIYQRKRVPWLNLFFGVLFFFFIFSARDEFRYLISDKGPNSGASVSERAGIYLNLLQDRLTFSPRRHEATYNEIAVRTNGLVVFGKVLYLTPAAIPYWGGFTYRPFLYAIFPRLIVVDKVKENIGQEFGHRYGILHYGDYWTSINLPVLVEFYVNFGPPGVLIGMFILGLIYRIFYTLLNHPEGGEGGFVIGLAVVRNILNMDTNLSLVFGNIAYYIILFYLIIRLTKAPLRNSPSQATY